MRAFAFFLRAIQSFLTSSVVGSKSCLYRALGCHLSYCFWRLLPISSKAFWGLIERGSGRENGPTLTCEMFNIPINYVQESILQLMMHAWSSPHRHTQTDALTLTHTDRHTITHTDRQADTDRQTDSRQTDRQTHTYPAFLPCTRIGLDHVWGVHTNIQAQAESHTPCLHLKEKIS